MQCLVCESTKLHAFDAYPALNRVTSDCRPWQAGGELYMCEACCTVQKAVNDHWLSEINTIYAQYEAYHQSEGEEQAVFNATTGTMSKRSEVLCDYIDQHANVNTSDARALDFGCSNGEFLSAFSRKNRTCELYGLELSDQYESALHQLNNFVKLYTELDQLDKTFDFVSMIHTLEHLLEPKKMLAQLQQHLKSEGALFIEVPDIHKNPFDILVADHLFHFSQATLSALLQRVGYSVIAVSDQVVAKELSLLASPAEIQAGDSSEPPNFIAQKQVIDQHLQYLSTIVEEADNLSKQGDFAIFGSSICATWLYSYFPDKIACFVDEDRNRIGKQHFGKPIVSVADIPQGLPVYMPLPLPVAESIAARYSNVSSEFILPRFDRQLEVSLA